MQIPKFEINFLILLAGLQCGVEKNGNDVGGEEAQLLIFY
jgi:hypothetical protein